MMLNTYKLQKQVREWLEEDIGFGDVTSDATIPSTLTGNGIIYAKCKGILAGIPVLKAVFAELDKNITVNPRVQDGEYFEQGSVLAELSGNIQAILSGERVALNVIQRMSGIATKTNILVQEAKKGNPDVRVVEARKTTPGLRMIEKYSVRIGGGWNHRYGLYDAVLIKDNHIKASGGIKKAILMAREAIPHTMKIEVEVESIPQVIEALDAKADIIMFDNMSVDSMKEAVSLVGQQAVTEASGGITIANIANIAAIGVNIISMGSLTYSVEALDFSLDLFEKKIGG